ncbi:MAG TPA: hypothetical protein VL282_15765 [Tepidisphaeraceae bacterium]|jgi:hypothetical protein|nr:hypothetical protein [Tepidisphaeraceae bacterium]
MQTLPSNCSDDDIRKIVVEWWELIVAGKYQQALEMFAHNDTGGIVWTPETLEEGIATGCCMSPPRGVPQSLLAQEDSAARIKRDIEVDREHLFGLDPEKYVGMVHFEELPMEPFVGALTARFAIMKVGRDRITLEFHDAHVM